MNTPLDRDALARRVFDAAICHPNFRPVEALNDWLDLIAGLGGYLCCTASAAQGDLPPMPEHLSAVGYAIEKAGKIAAALANAAETENLRLANLAKGQGGAA